MDKTHFLQSLQKKCHWKQSTLLSHSFTIDLLKVKYFEPSCKGSFQILNEKEYDVFIQDLDRKVDDPDTIRTGRRVFYKF